MRIRLLDMPLRPYSGNESTDRPSLFGGSYSELIPDLHCILAEPDGEHPFPRYGPRGSPNASHATYWEPALYLLVHLLGWSNPAKGLKWWHDQGQPVDPNSPLDALNRIWNADEQLPLLLAWFWAVHQDRPYLRALGRQDFKWSPSTPIDPGEQFWRDYHRQFPSDRHHRLFSENPDSVPPVVFGTNEIHLGESYMASSEVSIDASLLHSGLGERKATLTMNKATGWYFQLAVLGNRLPEIGERSWHVDVVVRPLGWLGTFRRSRETGLWFLGKHGVHIKGN